MIISDYGKKCVVIDLDETLVHSSFKVRTMAQPLGLKFPVVVVVVNVRGQLSVSYYELFKVISYQKITA